MECPCKTKLKSKQLVINQNYDKKTLVPRQDSNLSPPDAQSDTLTTEPHKLHKKIDPKVILTHPSDVFNNKWKRELFKNMAWLIHCVAGVVHHRVEHKENRLLPFCSQPTRTCSSHMASHKNQLTPLHFNEQKTLKTNWILEKRGINWCWRQSWHILEHKEP